MFDVFDPRLGLSLSAGPIWRARSNFDSPILTERSKCRMQGDLIYPTVVNHHSFGIID